MFEVDAPSELVPAHQQEFVEVGDHDQSVTFPIFVDLFVGGDLVDVLVQRFGLDHAPFGRLIRHRVQRCRLAKLVGGVKGEVGVARALFL